MGRILPVKWEPPLWAIIFSGISDVAALFAAPQSPNPIIPHGEQSHFIGKYRAAGSSIVDIRAPVAPIPITTGLLTS
jgi:hypothetical protein